MPRLRRICLFIVGISTLALSGAARAAAGPIESGLARTFEGLPADKIETGILYDRVLPLSRIYEHDGSARSAPASLREWRQIYLEMRNASLREPAWPRIEDVLSKGADLVRAGVVPIAVMDIEYDRIREDALATGALEIENGRLVIGEGDPFVSRRVFAAAPLRERTYHGEGVVFRLNRSDYFSNDAVTPQLLEADFDDGRGFVGLSFDEGRTVRYDRPGSKSISLRVRFPDGTERVASFPFDVVRLASPAPDDTLHITAAIPYLGQTGHGDAYVYLSDAHSSLTNPVIIIEGFDLDNSMNWDELYALLNQEALLETLRSMGYDAVVLNFLDSTDYMQRNAYTIVELIQQVRAAVGPLQTSALVGASMGGLAARYALAYMESNNLDHSVRSFISFDAPQSGADIPLGIQYWLDFFQDQSAEAAAMLASLDTPAARQLLAYHHTDPPGATGESDPLRAGFLADLAGVGSYPSGLRKAAIANGSGARMSQGFNAGDQIIRWEYSSLFVSVTGNVWAVPDAVSHQIFYGMIRFILFPTETTVTVSGTRPFDNAPGGWRASMATMDSVDAPYGDIIALHDNHCFIPTVSALDINTQDLFYDIANDPDILAQSPFDVVYFPQGNEEHVLVSPETKQWVIAEVEVGATTAAPLAAAGPGVPMILPVSPNPFSGTAGVRFSVPREGPARLSVYDASGRRVAVLADGRLRAGEHRASWNGRDVSGRRAGSGVYFLELRGTDFATSRKVVLD
jgi:hypothetical protein